MENIINGPEKIKANLNRENTQEEEKEEGGEVNWGFKNSFSNTIYLSKRSTNIKR